MEESDNQLESNNKPWLWKKGQSGNPAGRPKGITMKEWAKDYLSRMTDDERDSFMEGIPKERVWAMAEGNPKTETDVTSGGKPFPIFGGTSKDVPEHNSNKENLPIKEEN